MPMSCPVRVRQVSATGALPLGKSTRKVIVPRTESDQIAYGIRSDRVRSPIRSRSESDQIAYGVRLDSVRCPIGLRTVMVGKGGDLWSKISSFIFELSHRKTSIHYPLALSLWDSSEQ